MSDNRRDPLSRYTGTPGFPGLGTGASGQVGVNRVSPVRGTPTPPANPDPYNWRGIAAQLAEEQRLRDAARDRVQSQSPTRALGGAAPAVNAAPTAGPTIKELLDAYRAMNNGALPPGTTPEMAALIDKGIWADWSTIDTNPQLAQALMSIQAAITGLPAQYQEAKAGINQNYQSLTGGVMTAGQSYMNGVTPLLAAPGDPNAALIMQDPALSGYQNTLTNIGATAGLNQATDLSWFDKMLQNQTSNYEMMLRYAAMPQPVEEEEGGGGGGGGGGGRGGGGGGGGKDWTDPKTEITNTDLVQTNEADVQKGYNLPFWEALETYARSPEELAYFDQIFNLYKSNPQNVAAGLETEMTTAEAKLAELTAQGTARDAYEATVPTSIMSNSDQRRANLGNYVFADSPDDHVDRKKWMIDEDVDPNVQTEEQARFNTHAEDMDRLLAARLFLSRIGNETPNLAKWLNRKNTAGVANQVETLPKKWEQELIAKQQAWDEQKYHDFRTNWEGNAAPGATWNWNNWKGWIEPVDEEGRRQTEDRLNYAQQMAAIAAEYNPNKAVQNVSTTITDSATQKNQGVTKQHTYDPLDSIGPNLQDQPTGYNDANYMPEFQTPADDLIEGGEGIDPRTGLPYVENEFDPSGVFGESRALPRGASPTSLRLAAIAKESIRRNREGSRKPKSAIEAEENRPKLKAAPIKKSARTPRPVSAIDNADLKSGSFRIVNGIKVPLAPKTPKPKTPAKKAASRPRFARWR